MDHTVALLVCLLSHFQLLKDVLKATPETDYFRDPSAPYQCQKDLWIKLPGSLKRGGKKLQNETKQNKKP